MRRITLMHGLAIVVATLFASCDTSYFDNETEDFVWDGGIQAPIGFTTYTLSELFEEMEVEDLNEDAQGNLSFEYTQSISGGSDAAFDVEIDDVTMNSTVETPITPADIAPFNFPLTIAGAVPPNLQSVSDSDQVIHDLNLSQDLTAADFDNGTMVITFTSTFDADVTLSLQIPSFYEKTGDRVNNTYVGQVTLNGAETKQLTVNLNQYNADFTHDGTTFDATHNKVVLNLDATFAFAVGNTLTANDQISYTAVLSNASTEVVYGDFKQEAFDVPNSESINLDFFDSFGDGTITFTDAEMTVTATNGYGFPIGIDLSAIEAVNGGSSVTLKYDGSNSAEESTTTPSEREALLILDGLTSYTPFAPGATTTRILTKDNSNINELLSSSPTAVNLNVSGMANPIDAAPNANFYSANNTGFDADITINVPMSVKFENIELSEMMEFDDAEDLDDLKSVAISLTTENSIPLSGVIKLEFYDKNGIELTDIEKTIIAFKAAPVDANGKSNGISTETTVVTFNDIETLQKATDIKMIFALNSTLGEDSVVLNGNDSLTAYLGAKIGFEVAVEDEEDNN